MNYQQLQDKIVATAHRKDMVPRAPDFIEDARVRLNYRLGLELVPLVLPDDTNDILTANWLLYFYPAMKALYEFIVELDTAAVYEGLYMQEVGNHYVTAPGTEALVIKPECPIP